MLLYNLFPLNLLTHYRNWRSPFILLGFSFCSSVSSSNVSCVSLDRNTDFYARLQNKFLVVCQINFRLTNFL